MTAGTIDAPIHSEFIIMANARRICSRRISYLPNWSLAMEIFGMGSTWSRALCIRVNIDPDAKTVERKDA